MYSGLPQHEAVSGQLAVFQKKPPPPTERSLVCLTNRLDATKGGRRETRGGLPPFLFTSAFSSTYSLVSDTDPRNAASNRGNAPSTYSDKEQSETDDFCFSSLLLVFCCPTEQERGRPSSAMMKNRREQVFLLYVTSYLILCQVRVGARFHEQLANRP